jgi:hypothetical protein
MQGLTRRSVLTIAVGTGFRLYAFSSDFWNKKDPKDWDRQEIDQLTSKSPWAKEVSAAGSNNNNGYGGPNNTGGTGPMGGGGGPMGGGGGIGGIGGMGGGGMGGGRRNRGQMPAQNIRGTVRWESAKPIMEALRTDSFPQGFADHYIISVSGIPLDPGRRMQQGEDDDSQQRTQQALLDQIKGQTYLAPKDKRDVQPGIVTQQSSIYGNVLFGFSKDILSLKPEDKEVTFSTVFGRTPLKAKFILKEMLYHGELAV